MKHIRISGGASELSPVGKLSLLVALITTLASFFPSTMFVYQVVGADGVQPIDLLVTLLLGLGLTLAMITNHRWGLFIIPRAAPSERRKMVPIFWAIAFALMFISSGTGIVYVAHPGAHEAEITKQLGHKRDDTTRIEKALSESLSAEKTFGNADATGKANLQSELRNGGVCLNGGGAGPCVSVLQSLVASTTATRAALTEVEAQAQPILRDIDLIWEKIDQARASNRLSERERLLKLEKGILELNQKLEALRALVPLQVLETAILSFSRPFEQLGVTPVGANRLKSEYRPFVQQLDTALVNTRAPLAEPLVGYQRKTKLETIADNFGAVAFVVAIIISLDAIPLMLIGLFMVAAPTSRNQETIVPANDDDAQS